MTRNQVLEIKELRNEGWTNEQIAAKMNKSVTTIARWVARLREAGHEVKRYRRGRKKIEL